MLAANTVPGALVSIRPAGDHSSLACVCGAAKAEGLVAPSVLPEAGILSQLLPCGPGESCLLPSSAHPACFCPFPFPCGHVCELM